MVFQPVPPRDQNVRITGRLSYVQGPLGLNRPVRQSAGVAFVVRDRTGKMHPLGWNLTEDDGRFEVFAEAQVIPANVTEIECLLLLDYDPTDEKAEVPLDRVDWGSGTTQSVGNLSFNWQPPEKAFAEVNNKPFEDVRNLAGNLAQLLWDVSPRTTSFSNVKITLLREPSVAVEFTRAQQFFKDLRQHEIHLDFPERLIKEIEQIPMFRSAKKTPTAVKTIHDDLRNYLHKISMLQLYQFERGPMMEMLVKATGKALGWIISDPDSDAMPDAAAISTLIYIAGRMAKDGGRMKNLTFGSRPIPHSQREVKTVEMSVSR